MKFKHFVGLAAVVALLSSCSAPKKVIYIKDADFIPQEQLSRVQTNLDPILSPGDLLNIRVYSSDMTAVAPFNKGQYITPEGTISQQQNYGSTGGAGEKSTEMYLVDSHGNITFPVLGDIHVAGLTRQQVAEEIKNMIYPKYVKTPPTVETRLVNFRITVLGAVNSPGQKTSESEHMNILEAIALAGDLQLTGERTNVLLYRTNADGTREIHRLNLHDRNLLLSPYFNLQQNDFIYVEPNRSGRQGAWQMHQGFLTTVTVVSGISAIAGLVIGIINLK